MSNVSGKAYAMNLITPVYVQTNWLLVFFVPGILITLKAISCFTTYSFSFVGWGIGVVFLIIGLGFLILGLVRWIGISKQLNEFVLLSTSMVCFTISILAHLTPLIAIGYGVIGIVLVVVGIIFLLNGVTRLNKFIFWLAGLKAFQKTAFGGLNTLSLIHYARWVIVRDSDFPRLSEDQPKENLKYGYMLFFSNFNGSWTQYVDSFSTSIAGGLNLIWNKNVGWKDANVETPFNAYVMSNQIDTEHYYNAYPLASSNDIKSAKKVRSELNNLTENLSSISADEFKKNFDLATLKLQADLSKMEPTPIVSLAYEAIERRKSIQIKHSS